jgi:twitching motility protein PilT
MMDLKELLILATQRKASDLHLTYDTPPVLRINGKLTLTGSQPLTRDDLKKTIYSILTDSQKEKFEKDRELDFSLSLSGFV